MGRKKRNPASIQIANAIIAAYKPKSIAEMNEAIKDLCGPMFEAILKGEMKNHLGYESNSKLEKATTNRRNGYSEKILKTSMGETEIAVPRDRDSEFESMLIPKHKRDISATIDDIYGFKLSAEQISKITDCVLEEQQNWQNRPLKPFYPFIFVDCLFVNIRRDYESRDCAVYTILAYDMDGRKDILGLWIQETESKHFWMQIFDEIKSRGVQEVGFICMDGVTGLEEGAKAIFPNTVVQRCIVHLIRNFLKYVPTKDYKEFCAHLKKIYGAPSLKAAQVEFVTKRGAFPNDNSVFKVLYLRITEFYRKWAERPVANWALVRNQLLLDERFNDLFAKFDR